MLSLAIAHHEQLLYTGNMLEHSVLENMLGSSAAVMTDTSCVCTYHNSISKAAMQHLSYLALPEFL